MTRGVWRLVEVTGTEERSLCTSDYVDTLERIGARRRASDPALSHRVEPNTEPAKTYAEE